MPRKRRKEPDAPAGKARSTSKVVATKPGCAPLKKAYERAVALKPKNWSDVEEAFLLGMDGFDRNVAAGIADMGDLQNGKGDFFNDLLALILENCAGIRLYSRGEVRGLIFPKHHLDVTYPSTGTIEFVLEAKAVGTPRHPGSPKQREAGRPGSADLDKRVKEIGFKAIDLKAEYARIQTEHGQSPTAMAGDLTTWLRSVRPRLYVFFAARVISDKDRDRVIRLADQTSLLSDAVGVFCFGPVTTRKASRYRAVNVPPHLEMGRVLYRACTDLSEIKRRRPS